MLSNFNSEKYQCCPILILKNTVKLKDHDVQERKSISITTVFVILMNKTRQHNRHGQTETSKKKDVRKYRNYKKYEEKRKNEGKTLKVRLKRLKQLLRETFDDSTTVAQLSCIIDMVFRDHSYRGHVTYMEVNQNLINAYGLKKIPSKSNLWNMANRFSNKIEQSRCAFGTSRQ